MAFLVYRSDRNRLVKTGATLGLAGYNLIYRIWDSRGRPTDQGWHISREGLAAAYDPSNNTEMGKVCIPFIP